MKLKFFLLFGCLSCITLNEVEGNAGIFTYYETPLEQLGGRGPSVWRNIILALNVTGGNQCGGIGQATGFGQSPIVIPSQFRKENEKCDSDLTGFSFEPGTCSWTEMDYRIISNGVIVSPHVDAGCTLGRMKIPGNDNWYDALQFHVHTISEHSVDGQYFKSELHVVHRESSGKDFAVFGMFIDENISEQDAENELFEPFLKGWEAERQRSEEFCAVNKDGTGVFQPNSILRSRQMLMECPAVANGIDPETIIFDGDLPALKEVDYPAGEIVNVYEQLPTPGYGIYSYRGGLTTPPCTEIVNWNLLDTPLYLSKSQVSRLYKLILCFVERSTCQHATIANEFGGTNRPPQPLKDRTILHRCANTTENAGIAIPVPVPPIFDDAYPAPSNFQNGPWLAVLWPWFVAVLSICVYYLLNRFCHHLPYTAVMFLIGTFMGIGIVVWEDTTDQLSQSTRMWESINAELLLLVFLPGLLFRDAYSLNFHIFRQTLSQCLVMAFPMVLGGTALLACVGFFILPYGWSFSLAMTFGAILSATDPVAVNALLNEVGAPPRMKTHIAGEALLNDGSAIVFFTIFSSNFLYENFIPSRFAGLNSIDLASGIALFCRMSMGAVAIGMASALVLVTVLFMLHKRFNTEENVVQVMSTVAMAYLTYYVAEPICFTSGVIAVVTLGVLTKGFGSSMINDVVMMEKFWSLLEHLLNTILFTLGGVVWGTVISNADPTRGELFTGKDWGYLLLVYVLMTVVRFFLFFAFMPIIAKLGLGTNWKEAIFQSWGGLRGAVGISLAIALDNEVTRDTFPGDPRRNFTSQLFGLTGGVAFLTLVINGITCGPVLKKLGLADSSESRNKVVARYKHNLMNRALDLLLKYLGDSRFNEVRYELVKQHVPFLAQVPYDDLLRAVKRNKASTPPHSYMTPRLESFKNFVTREQYDDLEKVAIVPIKTKLHSLVNLAAIVMPGEIKTDEHPNEDVVIELRRIYIDYLRLAYQEQLKTGELDSREGTVVYLLNQSLELASDEVANGKPLGDFKWSNYTTWTDDIRARMEARAASTDFQLSMEKDMSYLNTRFEVTRLMAFIRAHELAEEMFKIDYCSGRGVGPAEGKVLEESRDQVSLAQLLLKKMDKGDKQVIVTHMLCAILLHNAAMYTSELLENNLLREQESEGYFHEIEHALAGLNSEVYETEVARANSITSRLSKALTVAGGLGKKMRSGKSGSFMGSARSLTSSVGKKDDDVSRHSSDSIARNEVDAEMETLDRNSKSGGKSTGSSSVSIETGNEEMPKTADHDDSDEGEIFF